MDSLLVALIFAAALALRCLIHTGLLWCLMRLQHLNHTVPKLLLAAVIATATTQIPFVGPYLSFVVLLVCLRRLTGEAVLPDLVFTVVVTGTLMFAVNLWLLATLLPSPETVRHSWILRWVERGAPAVKETPVTVIDLDEMPPPAPLTTAGKPAARREPSVQGVVLKGVMISRQGQFVLVGSGSRTQPLRAGEHTTFETPRGPVDVQCESMESNRVWMQIRGPARLERVELRFRSPLPFAPPASQGTDPAPAR
jgi:hypothetical protein